MSAVKAVGVVVGYILAGGASLILWVASILFFLGNWGLLGAALAIFFPPLFILFPIILCVQEGLAGAASYLVLLVVGGLGFLLVGTCGEG